MKAIFNLLLISIISIIALFACKKPAIDLNPHDDKIKFTNPYAVAADAQGNVYVTEPGIEGRNWILKMNPAGDISVFAGTGDFGDGFVGFRDGSSNTAIFHGTFGVTIDDQGNVYVADKENARIRKISSGVVSTVAGTGNFFTLEPHGLARDAQGNLYATDEAFNVIRKITPAGSISILAGEHDFDGGYTDGPGNVARFLRPNGIAVDNKGNIFVSETGNDCIRKITPSGIVSTFAGTGVAGITDGPGNIAQFNDPAGLATDAQGNVYVADEDNNRIRKITPAGVVSTLAGDGSPAKFNSPTGVATDNKGNLYVADNKNFRIVKIAL